jgi:MinD-like ATPase involved in chromosome partitioning or flagellar assembly
MPSSAHVTNPYLLIRSTVEAEIPSPGVLAVSSALGGDGKTSVATGIARSLAAAGYATLAVDAGGAGTHAVAVETATTRLADVARTVESGCDYLSIASAQARAASATTIRAFYEAIRERYEYAVIDTAVVSSGGLGFARAADGVMLAVREGRAVTDADRDAVELFARLHVPFLGVVATRVAGTPGDAGPFSLLERLQAVPPRRRTQALAEEPTRGVAFGRLLKRLARSVG